jgi:hypothetical protein
MVSIYLLNSRELCKLCFHSTIVGVDVTGYDLGQDHSSSASSSDPSPGSTCARQMKDGQKAETFLYPNSS